MIDLALANIFSPSQEARDPGRFAGRREQLDTILLALESKGSHIILYGDRGVGKSSLARQIELIASGNNALLVKEGLPSNRKCDFLVVFFTCDDSISSLPALFHRLISDPSKLGTFSPFQIKSKQEAESTSPKFDVKVISLTGTKQSSAQYISQVPGEDLTGLFISTIKKADSECKRKDGLLIILDEFDRLPSVAGFASVIKALSGSRVKFVLTGISNNVHGLVGEHESIGRQLAGGVLHVPTMTANELNEIFDIAERALNKRYTFEISARLYAIQLSKGHPFYIHLLGKHSLMHAAQIAARTIDEGIMRKAWTELVDKGAAPIQEHFYRKAIGCSYAREILLKMLASLERDIFTTSYVYPILSSQLEISKSTVSKHVRSLCADFGVFEEVGRRQYRFMDSMFRAYAAARPFIHEKAE